MHKNNEIIQGVKCVVSNCHYHNKGDRCGAGKIEIAPRTASNSEETDCNTFKPAESMN